jgi:hypothetical protein
MCFSATASFSSSVVIGAMGIYSIKSVTHTHQKYLAAIPLLFAVQQFSEGFVWLTLNHELDLKYQDFFTQSFLSFAWIIWPILVPFALYKFEFGGKGLPSSKRSATHPSWRVFGLFLAYVNAIALGIAYYFYINALPSTWCFMSAGISLLIIWIIKQNKLPRNS